MTETAFKNQFSEFMTDEIDFVISEMFAAGLKPIPLMTVSDWADSFRYLSTVASEGGGLFRTSKTPYNREIADNLGKTSDIWKTIVKKASQLGLTELGNNWIGYIIDLDPGPVIMVMPTDDAVKKNSRTRIMPMVESTPVLSSKIAKRGSKDAENTVQSKSFPGGVLLMIGANSPVGLSSTPARFVFLDEVDRYPLSAGGEGSPIDLAEVRTTTFSNRKMFVISTPTVEGESVISKEFLEGDQRFYNVPCIECGDLFIITWECITWIDGKPETARCACPSCGFLHEERHKTAMFEEEGYSENGRAKWVPTAIASDPLIRSYHLSGLYSPAGWLSWERVVRKFLKAQGNVEKEIVFQNTVLGETYKIKGESPDHENLYNRRENYLRGTVPDGVYFLTMGVDVQRDRLECEVVGWGLGKESWSVDYRILSGDTSKDEVWEELTLLLDEKFDCAVNPDGSGGGSMHISLTSVDASDQTTKVYDYTSKFPQTKVIAIRGASTDLDVMVRPPKSLNVTPSGKPIKNYRKLWYLGTNLLKSELYGFLGLKAKVIQDETGADTGEVIYPPGYCHFPEYGSEYFLQLTAEEQRQETDKKGYGKFKWHKIRDRNEALDVRCYARAAAYVMGMDRWKPERWDQVRQMSRVSISIDAPVQQAKPVKKSGYWDKRR